MREGWKCPSCSRINSPDITVCPCSDGGAAIPAVPLAPVPGGNAGITPPWRQTNAGTVWPLPVTVSTTWPTGSTVTYGAA
jgi:hypothetical protein